MSDQQTEIELPDMPIVPAEFDVPVKKVAANITKQPATMTTPNNSLPNFTILASLPWTFGDPMCCTQFRAEIWRGEYDDIFVTYWHESSCDVWRYVP